jgi:hypothetical protein
MLERLLCVGARQKGSSYAWVLEVLASVDGGFFGNSHKDYDQKLDRLFGSGGDRSGEGHGAELEGRLDRGGR